MAAGIAANAQEAVREHAALEIRTDLALYEAGDRGAFPSRSGEERDELRANDFVEESRLGVFTRGRKEKSRTPRPA